MQLRRLVLNNFRSFYGRHEIEFATAKSRSLTIIHGENGAGKTNLLNALYWCLTGEFTPQLKNPERLLNRAAYRDDHAAQCSVALLFQHENAEYHCRRRLSGKTSVLEIDLIEGAKTRSLQNAPQIVESIMPRSLAEWFFFDAEAIGKLQLSGSDEFRKSLRRILGFELVDALVDDLGICQTRLQRNLATFAKSSELTALQKRIDEIKDVVPKLKSRLGQCDARIATKNRELENIDAELRKQPNARPLEDQRARLEHQRRTQQQLKIDLQLQLASLIGDAAPSSIGLKAAIELESQLYIKENKGKLPAPFGEQLVEDILSAAVCICGRAIAVHSQEEATIRGLLELAATPLFNTRVREIQLLIKQMTGIAERYKPLKANTEKQLRNADQELEAIDVALIDIKKQLNLIDDESIKALQRSRIACRREYDALVGERAVLESNIQENEHDLEGKEAQYLRLSKQLGHGTTLRQEIDKHARVSAYLAKTLKDQEAKALRILAVELKRVLDTYLTKHFEPRIVPRTYKVTMVDSTGEEVGESTGEGQILKFAFISAVVALAARKTGPKVDFLAVPTVAPLVLDAPFSALDPMYQSAVARNLVEQASQVVLLISSAAWADAEGGGVGQALTPAIGKRYILISRVEGPRGSKPIKSMMIGKRQIDLNEYDAEREETVIHEVS